MKNNDYSTGAAEAPKSAPILTGVANRIDTEAQRAEVIVQRLENFTCKILGNYPEPASEVQKGKPDPNGHAQSLNMVIDKLQKALDTLYNLTAKLDIIA